MSTQKKQLDGIRILRVVYTDAERLELGKQLAEVHNNSATVNSDFDRVKAEFKSKLSALEAQSVDLAAKVSTGYSMKDVKCRWLMDTPKPGKKQLVRLDFYSPESVHPEAVVEVTDMTEHDKQVDLPLTEQPTGVANDGTTTVPADA